MDRARQTAQLEVHEVLGPKKRERLRKIAPVARLSKGMRRREIKGVGEAGRSELAKLGFGEAHLLCRGIFAG